MALSDFTLTSRRWVRLTEVRMSSTYGGLLEGGPSRRVNAFIVGGRVRAAEAAYPDVPVHLIATGDVEELPAVACVGHFESGEIDPAHDDGWHFSALVVVWFQPTTALPSGEDVDPALRGIAWDELARDYVY